MSGMYEFDKGTVVSRLNRWGRWKMASGVALGFSSMSAFMRLGGGTNPGDRFGDIDVECVETNEAVCVIPLFHQTVLYVEYALSYRESSAKAHKCGISTRRYREYLDLAHDHVAKKLNSRLISPPESDINPLNCSLVRPQTA